ncbi:MAG: hypothetical protein QOH76_3119 [Thermoleophilaceae bacterium]|nr:hypothetical protein [Thermoleophilaceae bacterium]
MLVLSALGAATAFGAARMKIDPKHAEVGNWVFASASGLKHGRYGLILVADARPTANGACLAHLGERKRTDDGHVYLGGRIPKRLTCYEGINQKLGTVRTLPGKYHLVVAVPVGPAGFRTNKSFVRRKFRVDG